MNTRAIMKTTLSDALLLLRRAARQLEQWHENYGKHQPQWLPPAGDVPLMEDISAALSAPPASGQGEAIELIAAYARLESEADKDFGNDADECYAIGKRDGFQDAVQLYDLATGGDGEFKGSTIPGETVDVPAMIERTVERFAIPAPAAPTRPKVSREALRDALHEYACSAGGTPAENEFARALGIEVTE